MMPDTPPGFGLLRISGAKAMPFLQGQLTCDLNAITSGKQQLAAHCNPQGRIISLFYLLQFENDYYLSMPESMLELTLNALKKYAVFFQVKMEIVTSLSSKDSSAIEIQKRHQIESGIPSIHPATSGKLLPQEINLDALGAISYEKGCYTGQEIIARLHYRGKTKSALHTIHLTCGYRPEPGMPVHTGELAQECGMIVESSQIGANQYIALAVIDDAQLLNALFLNSPNETITIDSGK